MWKAIRKRTIHQGQCEAFQTRMVTTPYEALSERTSAIRHTNKREGSAASKGPAAHCHSLPRCPPASSNTRRTSHNEGLHAGYGFDKLCKSNNFFLPQVRHPQVWSQRALCSFQPFPRARKADRTAPVQTEPEVNQCAVTRALEDVQVMHAAGRHEGLPPEIVKIEGCNWVNCSVDFQGFGNDFTSPNWNLFNSQSTATIMDVINQDRSEADGAQEDAMHEDLKTVFGSNNKSSLQHPGPISVRPDQMARIMLIKCTHPLIHRRPVCRSAGGLHHTQDLRSC